MRLQSALKFGEETQKPEYERKAKIEHHHSRKEGEAGVDFKSSTAEEEEQSLKSWCS